MSNIWYLLIFMFMKKVFVVLSIPFLRKSMLYFFLFFSSSDRIVYSVFLYTLALLKGRYSDQVFFFYKRFESNTENCSKCLYCPHCIHSPCMTVILCFWYFSFSWICIYYWFSLKCFFSRWKFINHVWLLVHLFYFLKFKSYIYSRYLHKPFDTSQISSQWIEF